MPELDGIVQTVTLSGQAEIVAAFGEIGKSGAEACKEIADAAGPLGELLGGIGVTLVGLGGAAFAWAKSSTDSIHELEILAAQSGETVESISTLQSALSAMGGSTEGLSAAFRRMGLTISNEWDTIKKDIADSSDKMIGSQLKVESAEERLFNARQARAKAFGEKGATPQELAYEKQREAVNKVNEAELQLHETQKKADQERLNAPEAYLKAVQSVIKGEQSFEEAGKTANLNVDNVVKGLIGNTEGAEEALKNFDGTLQSITGSGPKIKEVLYNIADWLKNSTNATLNQAVVMRLFGRYVGSEMIIPLQKGSDALKEYEAQMRLHGLVIDESMTEPTKKFHESFNQLSSVLEITKTQIGTFFATPFAEGMKELTEALIQNHEELIKWGEDLAKKATPYIHGFFDSLTGLSAYLSGDKNNLSPDVQKWEDSWERIGGVVNKTKDVVVAALNTISEALKAIGSDSLKPFEAAFYGLAGLAVWKTLGKTVATGVLGGLGTELSEGLGILLPAALLKAIPKGLKALKTGVLIDLIYEGLQHIKGDTEKNYLKVQLSHLGFDEKQIDDFLKKPLEEQKKILDARGLLTQSDQTLPGFFEQLKDVQDAQAQEEQKKGTEHAAKKNAEQKEQEQAKLEDEAKRGRNAYYTEDQARLIRSQGGPQLTFAPPTGEGGEFTPRKPFTDSEIAAFRAETPHPGPGIRQRPLTQDEAEALRNTFKGAGIRFTHPDKLDNLTLDSVRKSVGLPAVDKKEEATNANTAALNRLTDALTSKTGQGVTTSTDPHLFSDLAKLTPDQQAYAAGTAAGQALPGAASATLDSLLAGEGFSGPGTSAGGAINKYIGGPIGRYLERLDKEGNAAFATSQNFAEGGDLDVGAIFKILGFGFGGAVAPAAGVAENILTRGILDSLVSRTGGPNVDTQKNTEDASDAAKKAASANNSVADSGNTLVQTINQVISAFQNLAAFLTGTKAAATTAPAASSAPKAATASTPEAPPSAPKKVDVPPPGQAPVAPNVRTAASTAENPPLPVVKNPYAPGGVLSDSGYRDRSSPSTISPAEALRRERRRQVIDSGDSGDQGTSTTSDQSSPLDSVGDYQDLGPYQDEGPQQDPYSQFLEGLTAPGTFAQGGPVGVVKSPGPIGGVGSGKSDSNLAKVSKGEFVVDAEGSNLGEAIDFFTQGFMGGGIVGGLMSTLSPSLPSYASGGPVGYAGKAGTNERYELDLRTDHGTVPAEIREDAMEAVQQSALRTKMRQISTSNPSWYS